MTEPSFSSPLEPGAIAPKNPPPLNTRAPRPQAIRLRKPMVQGLVLGGAILLSGSLVWAFFIQREICGLRSQKDAIRRYAIPPEVIARLGIVRKKP